MDQWKERTRRLWDGKAADWAARSGEMWETGSRSGIIPFLSAHVEKGEICDLGCGDGYGSMLLDREGFKVTGLDLSEEMLRSAREHAGAGIEFVQGDLGSLPFEDGRFDAVMAINSLEWTEDPYSSMREIGRVLKPGGKACIAILGPTAGPREHGFSRLTGGKAVQNTMMPWEFEKLAGMIGWRKTAEKHVYKQGAEKAAGSILAPELKQALTFMTVFIYQKGQGAE